MPWIRTHFFDLLVGLVLALFVVMWLLLMIQTWTFNPTDKAPKPVSNPGVVALAVAISGALGAQTASAFGFVVAEIKIAGTAVTANEVTEKLPTIAYVAGLVYAAIGIAVVVTWLIRPDVAPETLIAFGLGAIGWLLGALSVALKPPSDSRIPH